MKLPPLSFAPLLILVCIGARPSSAHNGAIALARPVEDIAVDGELSDWPEAVQRYPLALAEYGEEPQNDDDFQGSFCLGYDAAESALYVAIEARDESTVIDTGFGAAWNASDGCELYIQSAHGETDAAPVQYWIRGGRRGVGPAGGGAKSVRLGNVAYARKGKWCRYEWKIVVGPPGTSLEPGRVLGLDVAVMDKDADGSFSWMAWGQGAGKVLTLGNVGDVVLVTKDIRAAEESLLVKELFTRNIGIIRQSVRAKASSQIFFTVVPLTLALLHFILFL